MPNIAISIYLKDEEYLAYAKRKDEINKKARELVKKEIRK